MTLIQSPLFPSRAERRPTCVQCAEMTIPQPAGESDPPSVFDYAGVGARYGIRVVRENAADRVLVPRPSLSRSGSRYLRELPRWKRIIALWFVVFFSLPLLRALLTSAPMLTDERIVVLVFGVVCVASVLAIDFAAAKKPWQSAVFEIQPDKFRVCTRRLFRTRCYSWLRPAIREVAASEATDGEGNVVGVKLGVWSNEGLEVTLLTGRPKEELEWLARTLTELMAETDPRSSRELKPNG